MAARVTQSYGSTVAGWRSFNTGRVTPYAIAGNGYIPGWGMPAWEDNFDASSLSSALWNIRNGYQEGQDVSTMLPANVILEDSHLKLRALKQTVNGRHYTSGYIDTINKWTRRYGRFESRMILPIQPNISRGMWPGLWLRDAFGGGECDIMESIGSPNDHPSVYPATPGRYSSSLYRQTGLRGDGNYWSEIFNNVDVADGQFHSWAVEWTPMGFAFFIDNILQHRISQQDYDEKYAPGFSTEVNWRIDLFIGSSWMGWPNDTQTILPRDFVLDYVRHYDYVDAKFASQKIAIIGDSLTYQNGAGEANLRAKLTDVGWKDENIYFYACSGKGIDYRDTNDRLTVEDIADARATLGAEPDVWMISLGSNGAGDGDPANASRVNAVMNAIGSSSKVLWIGTGNRDQESKYGAFNGVARPMIEAASNTVWADWQHRALTMPSSVWNSDGTHMSPTGYNLRNNFYIDRICVRAQ